MSTSCIPSFIKIHQAVLEKRSKMWKFTTDHNGRTDDGRCAMTIAYLSLWLRWAKNKKVPRNEPQNSLKKVCHDLWEPWCITPLIMPFWTRHILTGQIPSATTIPGSWTTMKGNGLENRGATVTWCAPVVSFCCKGLYISMKTKLKNARGQNDMGHG